MCHDNDYHTFEKKKIPKMITTNRITVEFAREEEGEKKPMAPYVRRRGFGTISAATTSTTRTTYSYVQFTCDNF